MQVLHLAKDATRAFLAKLAEDPEAARASSEPVVG